MATTNDGIITLTAAEALVRGRSVTINSSGNAALTGVGAVSHGVVLRDTASGGDVPVRLHNHPGTMELMVSGATVIGSPVYAAASGKGSATAVGRPQWVALETATTDGDVITVLPIPHAADGGARTVEAHTANDTLTNAESGSVHTTTGAAGTVTFSLPAATVGVEFYFRVGAAQELRIDPNGTETIALPSTGVAGGAGKYLTANAIGESAHIMCTEAGTWTVFGFTGTWTAEP